MIKLMMEMTIKMVMTMAMLMTRKTTMTTARIAILMRTIRRRRSLMTVTIKRVMMERRRG